MPHLIAVRVAMPLRPAVVSAALVGNGKGDDGAAHAVDLFGSGLIRWRSSTGVTAAILNRSAL